MPCTLHPVADLAHIEAQVSMQSPHCPSPLPLSRACNLPIAPPHCPSHAHARAALDAQLSSHRKTVDELGPVDALSADFGDGHEWHALHARCFTSKQV